VVLSRVGIRITGRSRRLRINYRTTDEIRRWAVAQLANCTIDDLDGQPDTLMGYKSLTHGETPLLLNSESRAEERKALLDALTKLDTSGVARRNTCLVVRRNEDVNEYADWLRSEGFDVLVLTREVGDDDERAGMRIATMHRVKGLEFDAVVVAGYVGAERYADMFAGDGDAGVLVDTLTSERSLLHVAATRAKYALVVSTLST
jgi:DNA helicase IV